MSDSTDNRMIEMLTAAFDHFIFDVHVAIPCVVINIKDMGEQRVDVQPAIRRVNPDGSLRDDMPIQNIQVMFPSTSTSALTLKVSKGDTVLCLFSHRCIDLFKAGNGSISNPIDLRKFDRRDAVAIVGISPFSKSINNPAIRNWEHSTDDTVLAHNIGTSEEVEIRLKQDGRVIINTHSSVEVNANSTTINSPTNTVNGNLTVNGNINCSQTVTATTDVVGGGKSLKNHKHQADVDVVCVNGAPWTNQTKAPT